jgi:hypothetical protein
MTGHSIAAQLTVYGLLGTTFALGLPLFHYVAALMIALVIRHGRGPQGLLAPLGGQEAHPADGLTR